MTAPPIPAPANAQLVIAHCTGNDYYRRAVETPELKASIALRAEAIRRRADLKPIPPLVFPDSVDDDLDEWEEFAVELDTKTHVRTVLYDAYSQLIIKCDVEIQGVIYEKDRILTSLASDLDGIMANTAQVVARLDGARTPAEAINQGVADVWQELTPLRDEYDHVRQAQDWTMAGDQRVIHCRSRYLHDDELATDLAIANLDEIFPGWVDPPQNHAIQRWDDRQRLQPWPADPIEQLVWMCTSGAEVWCPTIRQLDELKAKRMRDRAHPDGLPQPQPQRQELNRAPRAQDDYYSRVAPEIEITTPPVVDLDDRTPQEIEA